MHNLKLILPEDSIIEKYKNTFVDALHEGLLRTPPTARELELAENDFEAYYAERRDMNFVFTLPGGQQAPRVASTEFWLVNEDIFIGRIAVRHELSENLKEFGGHVGYAIRKSQRGKGYGSVIFNMALPLIKELGLNRVLITCDDNNFGSIKIIEKAGGILQDKIELSYRDVPHRRYWLEIK